LGSFFLRLSAFYGKLVLLANEDRSRYINKDLGFTPVAQLGWSPVGFGKAWATN
jgi:hypothetical protein